MQTVMQKLADLENTHENENAERATLQDQIKDLQNRLDEGMVMQWEREVEKKLEKVLPTAIQQGLRDLPYNMVCVYKQFWI